MATSCVSRQWRVLSLRNWNKVITLAVPVYFMSEDLFMFVFFVSFCLFISAQLKW